MSVMATSALNFNFDELIDKIEEIEDGKLVIRMGD